MIANTHILVLVDDEAKRIQTDALERLANGPLSLSDDEIKRRRYMLTDQLDDFIGATDRIKLFYIVERLVVGTSELALLSKSQWLASGKWLPRHLAISDPALSTRLLAATKAVLVEGGKQVLEVIVREILERVGGPFSEGYRFVGEIIG